MPNDVNDPVQRAKVLETVYQRKLRAITESPLYSSAPAAARELINMLNETHDIVLRKVHLMEQYPGCLPAALPLPSCDCDGGEESIKDLASCVAAYDRCTAPQEVCDNQFYLCILNC